jgi:hypothetical protein
MPGPRTHGLNYSLLYYFIVSSTARINAAGEEHAKYHRGYHDYLSSYTDLGKILTITREAMYVQPINEARSHNHCRRGRVSVCSVSYLERNAHAPYCHCGLSDCTTFFFSHYLTNDTILGKTYFLI